ncbi:MAG: ATP-dependent sacrificial sulfur transferase LarE [Deltaproteobacteria bacterium]|nr:ATP-dependent sacrificial sulfur transferase LarE [Deltaproteobacteria bacterium]
MPVKQQSLSIEEKLQRLQSRLSKMDSLLIAFSGGVDSSFLLAAAALVLREKTVALMTVSSATPPDDERQALRLAEDLKVPLLKIPHDELTIPQYAANPKNRCYFCKDSLYTICKREAERLALHSIADGINLDDLGDYRPGIQAATEYGILHPLVEEGFTKTEIRQGSRILGLTTWDKPASPCLSSRIPYGSSITAPMLQQIAQGETLLRNNGFKEVRVRHHGKIARIEIARGDLPTFTTKATIRSVDQQIRELGFTIAGLDLGGYRTGVFNENVPTNIHLRPHEQILKK